MCGIDPQQTYPFRFEEIFLNYTERDSKGNTVCGVHRNFESGDLQDTLQNILYFLQQAGYTYVQKLAVIDIDPVTGDEEISVETD